MNILILGEDGYIGKPLKKWLERKHNVWGIDNYSRRKRAEHSLTGSPNVFKHGIDVKDIDLSWFPKMDAIIHLAQQPSAPWSMASEEQSKTTQQENVIGNLALLWKMKDTGAHLIKLGSMGEYGTPDCRIPEGFIDEPLCTLKGMMFPRQPGSFYHLSKVFDSMNIKFTCDIWGIRSTDIMQGVVFGLNYWDHDLTRFDYDENFGTVINRFCAQLIAGHPLTIYGSGNQTRGFIPLEDSIKCIELAIENPPKKGEYRVFNQYAQIHKIKDLAKMVQTVGAELGINTDIKEIENPRVESENHIYETTNQNLKSLGYNPKWEMKDELKKLIQAIKPYSKRVNKDIIKPKIKWNGKQQ